MQVFSKTPTGFFFRREDLLNEGSIVPLAKSHPEIVTRGLRLKKLANKICEVVAGRHIHPISFVPGGVAHIPKKGELKELKKDLEESFEDLSATLDMFKTFEIPQYSKKREYISLKEDSGYAFYSGNISSSQKYTAKPGDYRKVIKENIAPQSTAKHAISRKGVFMVGALARTCNNFTKLSPAAKKAARKLGLSPDTHNPFMNNIAQLVETFHCAEDAIKIIDKLMSGSLKKEELKKPKKYGRGAAVVEAPRGSLYHEYTIGKNGIVEDANCIIPTAQNLAIIEDDLRNFIPTILNRPKEEITRGVESLVRGYDPCISCSTHIMDVRFV